MRSNVVCSFPSSVIMIALPQSRRCHVGRPCRDERSKNGETRQLAGRSRELVDAVQPISHGTPLDLAVTEAFKDVR
jgi:hypothetical protein